MIYIKLQFAVVIIIFIQFLKVDETQAESDEDFCHPHCLVTCLPSCACCNPNDDASKSLETNRRLQAKLERLEQILKDKDLEVGFVCHESCKHRCLPSCKFECCRSKTTKRNKLKSKTMTLPEGFDLKKLLKSMEDTQRQYKKFQKFIEKVNTSPSEKKHAVVEGFQFVDEKKKKKNEMKKMKIKSKNHENKYKEDRLQNIQILEKLVKLQDEIPNKANRVRKEKGVAKLHKTSAPIMHNDESVENQREEKLKSQAELQRVADSPYQKLLSSKAKLKVDIEDTPKSHSLNKKTKASKQSTAPSLLFDTKLEENVESESAHADEKPMMLDMTDRDKPSYAKHHGKGYCASSCKQYCYPSCNFECCTRTIDLSSSNASKETSWKTPFTLVSDKYKNISTSTSNPTVANPKLSKLANLLNMPDTQSLLHTKNQLDNLISLLKTKSSVLRANTRNTTGTFCQESCRKECVPTCPFNCC